MEVICGADLLARCHILATPCSASILEAKNIVTSPNATVLFHNHPMLNRILLLGLLTAGLVRAEDVKDSYSETHPLDPRGDVKIENVNGAILIQTWERAEVSVQVEKIASSPDYLKAINVEITSDRDSLSVKTHLPKHEFAWHDLIDWSWIKGERGRVDLTLMVPSGVRLGKIVGVNGSITLEGTHGAVDATTVNGAIHATGLREGKLTTVNGSVHASVDKFDADSHLTVSTVNGSVAILLPKDAGASVNVSTVNGQVSCDFPIKIEADKGFFGHSLTGVIGPGGGSVKVSTVNGSVHLQSL
jgi:DUF4097 and DUF4098 domain-containing protein YvlB